VKTSNHSRYVVKSLVHATRVIEAFQSAGDVLRLRDVVIRTGYSKGMCFGCSTPCTNAASWTRWARTITAGLGGAAAAAVPDRLRGAGPGHLIRPRGALGWRGGRAEHIELIVVDNRYSPRSLYAAPITW